MPRPRVLINALSLSDGGGRSYVTNLLRELSRDDRGYRFRVLALPGALDGIETGGVEVQIARPVRSSHRFKGPARVLYEQSVLPLYARDADLLYCIADVAPLLKSSRSVLLCRNLNIYDRRWYDNSRTRILARLAGLSMRRVDRVLFPSRAAADAISALAPVPRGRSRVIPYGVSLEHFETREPTQDAGSYLFLPASPERHKNMELLIRCLPLLRNRETQVWIAGKSLTDLEHQKFLEELVRSLGLEERVRFLGAVPYSELPGYYRAARALVFPSFIETFGHPIVEAMAAGTPVLASDIPTFREVAGDAALYFPLDSPESLAEHVQALDSDVTATRARVARGRERARRFSWSHSVDALCAAFEEVLA